MKSAMKWIAMPACIMVLVAAPCAAQQKTEMRDAATHDSLVRVLQSSAVEDPMAKIKPSETTVDPTKAVQTDLLERADIISFNGLTTFVPKRSILVLPESMMSRVGTHKPGHRFVDWAEFLQANRAWITTVEVTRAQAQGAMPLPVETEQRVERAASMIVATLQGGPISVRPSKEPESETLTEDPSKP